MSQRLNAQQYQHPHHHHHPQQGSLVHQLVDFGSHAVVTICRTAYEVTYFWLSKMCMIFWEPISLKNEYEKMKMNATTYQEWKEAAEALDDLEGNEEWKQSPVSLDYDYELIHNRLIQLRKARELNDVNAIAFLLRTSITRSIGGIGNEKLYSISHIGTKHLIEEYIDEVGELLDYCAESKTDWKEIKSQIEFFKNIRHSFGNTALLLSGGAAMGSHHIGVVKCLVDQKCLPRIVSGSSAGAIVASIVCTRSEIELPKVTEIGNMNWNVLEEPLDPDIPHRMSIRIFRKLKRLFNQGVLFDNEVLKRCMKDNLGDVTFIEAYNRTRRILNIAVSSNNAYQMSSLLNYITAPNVVIWSAVVASCALPAFYKSGKLQAKDSNGQIVPWNRTDESWIDGSVENDLPMRRVAQLFNVNHFIVSQVNPHIVPFIQKSLRTSFVDMVVKKCLFLIKSELQYRLPMLIDIGIFPRHCRILLNVLSQTYTGDITIVPDHIALNDLLTMFSSLNPERVKDATLRAERATWPKLSIIKNHTSIELKLDQILYRLKCRLLDLLYNPPASKPVVPEEKSMIENLMSNMDSDLVHANTTTRMFGYSAASPSPSYYLDLEGRSKAPMSRPAFASQPALNYVSPQTLSFDEDETENESLEDDVEAMGTDGKSGDEQHSTTLSNMLPTPGYAHQAVNGQHKSIASAAMD